MRPPAAATFMKSARRRRASIKTEVVGASRRLCCRSASRCTCSCLQQGQSAWSRPVAPTRSGRDLHRAASPLLSALCRSCRALARRLRTRSIARSLARTIVTCPKSAPPCALAPQLVGAEVAHVQTRPLARLAWLPLRAARPKCRQGRGVRKSGRPRPTMIFNAERRQPVDLSTDVLIGNGRMAALGRAEGPTSWGAIVVARQGLLSRARGTSGVPLLVPLISLDFRLSDACSIPRIVTRVR